MHAPRTHADVFPEQTAHPAVLVDVPQCAGSAAEHAAHAPESAQYVPVPQFALLPHPQVPLRHAGVAPEHGAHPADDEAVPQCAASADEHATHAPDAAQ